mgnify:FL=1
MNPKVSVIMPVYNAEKYLEKSVASILEQTLDALELILVNDGSLDGSGKICDMIAEKNPRVRVIHQNNTGVSCARNAGLAAAQGEYVGFVDADDVISKNMFSVLYHLAVQYECDLVSCRYCSLSGALWEIQTPDTIWIDSVNQPLSRREMDRVLLPAAYKGFDCAVWNKLFKRKLIERENIHFKPGLSIGEDYLFVLNYLAYTQRYYYTTQVLYYYYVREGSAIRNYRAGYIKNYYDLYKEKKRLISHYYKNSEILKYNNMLWYLMIGEDFLKSTEGREERHIKKMRAGTKLKIILPCKVWRRLKN